jgi:hypothetical protein
MTNPENKNIHVKHMKEQDGLEVDLHELTSYRQSMILDNTIDQRVNKATHSQRRVSQELA